jgi:hypothetical protein
MTKGYRFPAIFLTLVAVDVICLVMGKPRGGLSGFGARGLIISFAIGIVLLFRYPRED